MTEAIVIFAVIFGACMFAIGAWAADGWVRAWRGTPKQKWVTVSGVNEEFSPSPILPPVSYSPPLVTRIPEDHAVDALRHVLQHTNPATFNDRRNVRAGYADIPPNPATFQNFAADSADERGAWGPTA